MLQCGRCRQWFHTKCISSLNCPVFFGDRFVRLFTFFRFSDNCFKWFTHYWLWIFFQGVFDYFDVCDFRFFVFVCSICNNGKEFVRRLEMKWVDVIHLSIFHLTLITSKKYLHVDNDILKFMNFNWKILQLPKVLLRTLVYTVLNMLLFWCFYQEYCWLFFNTFCITSYIILMLPTPEASVVLFALNCK